MKRRSHWFLLLGISISHNKRSFRVRASCSVYAGHGARTRSVRLDACTSDSCHREIDTVCFFREKASSPTRCLANVPRQRAHKFYWSARRCHDREFTRGLACRSAAGLLFVLVAITKTRQGRAASMVGTNIAFGSRWGHDERTDGELHPLPGRPRGDGDSSIGALLDREGRGHLSSFVRKYDTHHCLGRMGDLAIEFEP